MYKLKKGQYLTIQAFMVEELGLTGNDLLVYAIIYGFSQDGESVFTGNRAYLATWCNCSERSIQRNLNSLMERGLIEQVCHSIDNRKVYYKAKRTSDNMSPVTFCHGASDNMSLGLVTFCENTSDNMSPVYIDNKNIIKQDNKKEREGIVVCDDTPSKKKFQKPTIEEITAYIEERGSVVDPIRFFNFYESNGWKVGKNPMKDWKAAVRTWEIRDKEDKKNAPKASRKPDEIPYMQKNT